MFVDLFSNLLSTDAHCLIIIDYLVCTARYCWFCIRQRREVYRHQQIYLSIFC